MNIQQLRAQIAALQDATMDENRNFTSTYDEGKFDALSAVDALLDSFQEEPSGDTQSPVVFYGLTGSVGNTKEEHVSEDLEKISYYFACMCNPLKAACSISSPNPDVIKAFKAGAQWQAEQFEKNRLKHCDALTEEQAQIESDFVTRHLKENDRTPTFIDAIEYGMRLQKEKITKDVGDDLPIWRKRNDFEYPTQFCGVLITGGDTTTLPVFVADGYEIPIKDLLEKLPKED